MSKNDITGDDIKTDAPSDKFRSGWDLLWGKKEPAKEWTFKEEPCTTIGYNPKTVERMKGIHPDWFPEWDPKGDIIRRAQEVSVELKPKYAPGLTEEFIKGFFPNKA